MNRAEKGNFWIYVIGTLVSILGSGIQAGPLGIYIYDVTKSGFMMALFSMAVLIPRLIITPFAGVIGDRWNRKNIMVNMDLARGAIIVMMGILAFSKMLTIPMIFVLQAVISVMDAIFGSATGAMLPDLIPAEDLKKGNSLMAVIRQSCYMVGPIIGFALYGFLGIGIVFLLNGISFILSGISEIFIKYTPKYEMKGKLTTKDFVEDIKVGTKFIFSNKGLVYLFSFALLINFLTSPLFEVVTPFVLRKDLAFTNEKMGLVETVFLAGAILGGILVGTVFSKLSGKKSMSFGIISMFGMLLPMGFIFTPASINMFGKNSWTIFALFSVFMVFGGICNAFVNIPIGTNLQTMTPSHLRSRVFSVLDLFAMMAIPVGNFLVGLVIDKVPGYAIFMILSGVALVLSIVFIVISPAETFDPKPVEESEPQEVLQPDIIEEDVVA